jgi:glycosyltransferase involved in cell wall biosynthesis
LVEVSVIIPSLNEAGTIGTCIEKVKAVFRQYGIDGEIIVADNSDDDTPRIARSLGAKVVTPDRRGYGYAYSCGFKHAEGKFVVIGDGDDTYDFLEIPRLLEPLMKDEADIVFGSRFKGEIKRGAMPWLHRYVGNPALTGVLNWYFRASVSDAHCGFRAIRKDALEKMRLQSQGMEFASEMIVEAVRRKLRIKEVPVTYYPRETGRSKLNSFSDGWRHLKFMFIYAPTYLYLLPGLIFSVFGALMMLLSYFSVNIGYTPGFHSMIVGSLLVIVGYQVIYLGLYAKVYGVRADLFDTDRVTKFIFRHVSLERGAILGLVVFLAGFAYSLYFVTRWVSSGYSVLPLNGEDIVAFTLLTIGLQAFFNSFLLSMLGNGGKFAGVESSDNRSVFSA